MSQSRSSPASQISSLDEPSEALFRRHDDSGVGFDIGTTLSSTLNIPGIPTPLTKKTLFQEAANLSGLLATGKISGRLQNARHHSGYRGSWLWEGLSWIMSLLTFIVIVVILGIHDGQPIPQWNFFGITLNALISVLSTIGKTLPLPALPCMFGGSNNIGHSHTEPGCRHHCPRLHRCRWTRSTEVALVSSPTATDGFRGDRPCQ